MNCFIKKNWKKEQQILTSEKIKGDKRFIHYQNSCNYFLLWLKYRSELLLTLKFIKPNRHTHRGKSQSHLTALLKIDMWPTRAQGCTQNKPRCLWQWRALTCCIIIRQHREHCWPLLKKPNTTSLLVCRGNMPGGSEDRDKGRAERRDEGGDKEKQYAGDRRPGVTVAFTDLLPQSLFM